MKLTPRQARVLRLLQFATNSSAEQWGKKLKLPSHVVRREVRLLREGGAWVPTVFIDYAKVGFIRFNLFFALPQNAVAKVLSFLRMQDEVIWLAENGGDYRYEATIATRGPQELLTLLDRASEATGTGIVQKSFGVEAELAVFGAKYLAPSEFRELYFHEAFKADVVKIDELDAKILQKLKQGSASTVTELARAFGIPQTSIAYRKKRLTDLGVIGLDSGAIDPAVIGKQELQILVASAAGSNRLREPLFQYAMNHPNILAFIRIVGQWDFKLVVHAGSLKESYQIEEELRAKFASLISETAVIPRLALLKAGDFPVRAYKGIHSGGRNRTGI